MEVAIDLGRPCCLLWAAAVVAKLCRLLGPLLVRLLSAHLLGPENLKILCFTLWASQGFSGCTVDGCGVRRDACFLYVYGDLMVEYVEVLLIAAFCAGLVDAMGGGGGLVQVPALFSVMGQSAPATLLGTNKLASIWGTATAAWNFHRRVRLEWNTALPAAMAALVSAFCGAFAVTLVPGEWVRKLLPLLLLVLLVYTWRNQSLGLAHVPAFRGGQERLLATLVGAAIGFYDGFFGPGTGSFLIFLFVRFFGFDFLRASAVAKVVNVACNLAALSWFSFSGHVLWRLGFAMAVCNILGSLAGSHLALRHGSWLVRRVFLLVVAVLMVKTAFDAFWR